MFLSCLAIDEIISPRKNANTYPDILLLILFQLQQDLRQMKLVTNVVDTGIFNLVNIKENRGSNLKEMKTLWRLFKAFCNKFP